jgi:putative alpha-1,2-mannosidase
MRECVERSFGVGRGGLPGNNDSGGLSSFFVFATLGIFPAPGKGEFLVGLPMVNEAELSLSGGKTLRIIRKDNGGKYVSHVSFNGTEVEGYRLPMGEVMAGGELTVEL